MVASKAKIRGWGMVLGKYFKNTARNLDVFAADEFMTMWNSFIVKNGGESFKGNHKTISYHLGSNQLTGTLTKFGKAIAWICDKLDKNHCYNAYIAEKDK